LIGCGLISSIIAEAIDNVARAPTNPKTLYIVVLSAIDTLKNISGRMIIVT
jgi:predicted dinucleotide-utilizing enzyme